MESQEIKDICRERFSRWTGRMLQEHATPILALGVGHDGKSGQLTICTLEEMNDKQLLLFLSGAQLLLEKKIMEENGYRR